MENKEFQFRTNINCGGCIAKVKADLDAADGICEWKVDIANNEKILTVTSTGITEEEVIAIIRKKGFKAEPVTTSFMR